MGDCCSPRRKSPQDECPECGQRGKDVQGITLKALLRPEALARHRASEHRFCPSPGCAVVYFGEDEIFRREDVLVPVFQKEPEGVRLVCYCFAVGEDQIRQEIEVSGTSASAERIKSLVQAGRCACEVRNPQGSCCLGSVTVVVKSVHVIVPGQTSTTMAAP
jgi:hypothetical protein